MKLSSTLKQVSAIGALLLVSQASAISTNFGSDDIFVKVDLTDIAADQVQIDLSLVGPNIADIRGFWAELDNYTPLSLISGADITSSAFGDDSVSDNLGGGVNINGGNSSDKPSSQYDLGLVFGTPGIGNDDIQSTSFVLSGSGLTSSNFIEFAARGTSVGAPGSSRSGSSKVWGGTTTRVPDGGLTLSMLGTALLGMLFVKRKR
ncbi:VPDSG-CTERM sorting domain-containing protein [Puniceicoccaceae bacterium K14]|nr:VPDSG-CTERM sorting domain-containing protein [Puniceicoccaceae bacterium K14]